MLQTKTELHTHFMGILSAKGFISFLKKHAHKIFWPLDKEQKDCKELLVSKILSSKKSLKELIKSLTIPYGQKVSYIKLNEFYEIRRRLLNRIVEQQPGYKEENKFDIKTKIYNEYFNECLKELFKLGVKLIDITETNPKLIRDLTIDSDIKNKIFCRFLLGFDRNQYLDDCRQRARQISQLLNDDKNMALGIDIMGYECKMDNDCLNYSDSRKKSKSFKRKLEEFIKVLNQSDNTVLRIHAGENEDSKENPEKTLQMIDEICKEQKITIPPPAIRLGHASHFIKNINYIKLLKKYNVIIEINATSNYALSNINNYDEIPYKYYLKNKIPIVLATDGHGLYDTSIMKEDFVALLINGENYNDILAIDDVYINTEVGKL